MEHEALSWLKRHCFYGPTMRIAAASLRRSGAAEHGMINS